VGWAGKWLVCRLPIPVAILILAIRLTMIDPLSIFSLLHDVQEIRRGVQSVLKNDWVDDFAATGATETRDADLTSIVLKVHVIFRDHQSPATHAGVVGGVRGGTLRIVRSPIRFHWGTHFVADRS